MYVLIFKYLSNDLFLLQFHIQSTIQYKIIRYILLIIQINCYYLYLIFAMQCNLLGEKKYMETFEKHNHLF